MVCDEAAIQRIAQDEPLVLKFSKPLHACAGNEFSQQLCDQLIAMGAELDDTNDEGISALQCHVCANRLYGAATLLACGAAADLRAPNDDTALHMAMRAQLHEMISLLLAYGSDINVRNAAGERPVDMGNADLWAKAGIRPPEEVVPFRV